MSTLLEQDFDNSIKVKVSANTAIELGNPVYYSARPESTLSNLLDWRITNCRAAEQVTVTDDGITTDGRTFDLIRVSQTPALLTTFTLFSRTPFALLIRYKLGLVRIMVTFTSTLLLSIKMTSRFVLYANFSCA